MLHEQDKEIYKLLHILLNICYKYISHYIITYINQ